MRKGKTGTAKEGSVNAPRFSDNHSLEASPPTTQPRVWPSGAGQHSAVPTPTSGKEGLEGSLLLTPPPNTLTSDTLGQRKKKKKRPEILSFHLFPLILSSSYFISNSGVGASVALCSPWGRSLDSILLSIQGRQGFALIIMVALTYSRAQQICVQGMNGSMNEWVNEVMKLPWGSQVLFAWGLLFLYWILQLRKLYYSSDLLFQKLDHSGKRRYQLRLACEMPKSSTRAQGHGGTSSKTGASSLYVHLAKFLPATRWQPEFFRFSEWDVIFLLHGNIRQA